jgi:hypothetical protein
MTIRRRRGGVAAALRGVALHRKTGAECWHEI